MSALVLSEEDARFVANVVAGVRQSYADAVERGEAFTVEISPEHTEAGIRMPFGSPEHVEKLKALREKHSSDVIGAMLTGITDGVLEFIEELHAAKA